MWLWTGAEGWIGGGGIFSWMTSPFRSFIIQFLKRWCRSPWGPLWFLPLLLLQVHPKLLSFHMLVFYIHRRLPGLLSNSSSSLSLRGFITHCTPAWCALPQFWLTPAYFPVQAESGFLPRNIRWCKLDLAPTHQSALVFHGTSHTGKIFCANPLYPCLPNLVRPWKDNVERYGP